MNEERKQSTNLTGINASEVMLERAEKLKDLSVDTRVNAECRITNYSPEVNETSATDMCISGPVNFLGFARFYFQKEGCLQ